MFSWIGVVRDLRPVPKRVLAEANTTENDAPRRAA
jgi:hypothetical protein